MIDTRLRRAFYVPYTGSMGTLYDIDIVAWAEQQAALLRAGRFPELDVEHIVEEIEAVGRGEKRELKSRLAVLLAHLLKWHLQPSLQGSSWSTTIENQREEIEDLLDETPSLKHMLEDEEFLRLAWRQARRIAKKETGLNAIPSAPLWPVATVLDAHFLPWSAMPDSEI